jgi:hypothetical protein
MVVGCSTLRAAGLALRVTVSGGPAMNVTLTAVLITPFADAVTRVVPRVVPAMRSTVAIPAAFVVAVREDKLPSVVVKVT